MPDDTLNAADIINKKTLKRTLVMEKIHIVTTIAFAFVSQMAISSQEKLRCIKFFDKKYIVKEEVLNQFGLYKTKWNLIEKKPNFSGKTKDKNKLSKNFLNRQPLPKTIKKISKPDWDITTLVKTLLPKDSKNKKTNKLKNDTKIFFDIVSNKISPCKIKKTSTIFNIIKLASLTRNEKVLKKCKIPFLQKIAVKPIVLKKPLKTFELDAFPQEIIPMGEDEFFILPYDLESTAPLYSEKNLKKPIKIFKPKKPFSTINRLNKDEFFAHFYDKTITLYNRKNINKPLHTWNLGNKKITETIPIDKDKFLGTFSTSAKYVNDFIVPIRFSPALYNKKNPEEPPLQFVLGKSFNEIIPRKNGTFLVHFCDLTAAEYSAKNLKEPLRKLNTGKKKILRIIAFSKDKFFAILDNNTAPLYSDKSFKKPIKIFNPEKPFYKIVRMSDNKILVRFDKDHPALYNIENLKNPIKIFKPKKSSFGEAIPLNKDKFIMRNQNTLSIWNL